jgi:four helix bundle protein
MNEFAHQSFTELEVWKKARVLKNEVMELTKCFPNEEKFRLADQLIRASRSINANIAEGHGRFTFKDQLHFCIQARGSLSETLNHLIDAFDCGYITPDRLEKLKMKSEEIRRLLNGDISFLRKSLT